MVAEGESWRMSESHGCRRFRLAKMANDEPTRWYDLGTLDLDLELELRKTKKRRGSKRRKMGTRTCICSSNMFVFLFQFQIQFQFQIVFSVFSLALYLWSVHEYLWREVP